jgi:hypothetical protein
MHGILLDFIEAFGASRGYVSLAQRNGPRGYVHVVPPGLDPKKIASRHLLVERNGTVCVTEQLHDTLGALLRPPVPIDQDPLGYSAGPRYGRFRWGITQDHRQRRWRSEQDFVAHAVKALCDIRAHRGPEQEEEGDYP